MGYHLDMDFGWNSHTAYIHNIYIYTYIYLKQYDEMGLFEHGIYPNIYQQQLPSRQRLPCETERDQPFWEDTLNSIYAWLNPLNIPLVSHLYPMNIRSKSSKSRDVSNE